MAPSTIELEAPYYSHSESEFGAVLERLGAQVAGRYHTCSDKLEDKYALSDTLLGAGANGDVQLAYSQHDAARAFAVKTISFSSIAGIEEWTMLENQLEVALRVDHPKLVGVTDVYETDEALHLVMPCLEGGALGQQSLPSACHKDTARELLLALEYLHGHGIVHRDIKPSNAVLEQVEGNHLKLIDFDLCTMWQPGHPEMHECCGTPGFMSPELRSGKGYTSQTDMWSLGVTLFQLFVGEMPFSLQDIPDQQAVDTLLNSQVAKGLEPGCRQFLTRLLQVDPSKRPCAQEALRDPFLLVQKHFQEVVHPVQCRSTVRRLHGAAFRRQPNRRPLRNGRSCISSARNERCSNSRPNPIVDVDQLLSALEEHPLLPIASVVQHKIAAVRWEDLDDEDDAILGF